MPPRENPDKVDKPFNQPTLTPTDNSKDGLSTLSGVFVTLLLVQSQPEQDVPATAYQSDCGLPDQLVVGLDFPQTAVHSQGVGIVVCRNACVRI